jgi:DNA-binding NtrC family response regulator
LANAVEHALVLCDELPLSVEHMPARLGGLRPRPQPVPVPVASVGGGHVPNVPAVAPRPASGPVPPRRPTSLRELEMQAILEGLERNAGNKPRTAEELGISLKTLYNKLHQLQDGQLDRTG